jgi:ABC-2 type transport system permease protein
MSLKWIKGLVSDIAAIWANEMKMTVKDEGVLVFFILAPLLYPILYSWIYNNEVVREVPVAAVDLSHSAESREFLRKCDASPDVKIAYHCNNIEEARELVGRQVVHGIMFFPTDFSTKLNRGEQANVSVFCDMSLMLTYKAIYQTATAVSSEMNAGIQIAQSQSVTDRDEEITTKPLDFDEVEIFNPTGGYGNAILPGVLIIVIQQTLLLGIGLAAGTARERNRNHRLVPMDKHYGGAYRIVLGKALCYMMIYAVVAAYLTLGIIRIFHFTTLATPEALFGLMLPYLLACIFFGMIISGLIRYRENVMLIVVFLSLIFLFMTGLSWPESNIPGFWKGISWLVPSTFGVQGFLKISSMGASISEIRTEYIVLWTQAFVYFIITCVIYQRQIDLTRKHSSADNDLQIATTGEEKQ